ncbi:MAG: hypothetical protein ACNYWM_08655, partial [Methanosarcinales archaeon]
PLKQGLKLIFTPVTFLLLRSRRATSIKTRIETIILVSIQRNNEVAEQLPLKQVLKLYYFCLNPHVLIMSLTFRRYLQISYDFS